MQNLSRPDGVLNAGELASMAAIHGFVLVRIGDLPLIQVALRAYSVSLRRQARGRGMSGPHNRSAREETRAQASRASQLAGQIGRR
jgi:hypothetical protein